ncbi:MAG: aerobic carbon-monoxide dehydrogenase medium subunit [Thermoleophilaceae bacterium]|jgi:carbon-monoxide dehydrogenase medium subunit|nr:aerobic carbon-monoxide dehydrogenase medium subunit [Thermoleophilaceae bacterium]MEA2456775.1 aerobic carbon-monoxide dehydrogenase medium subunit [Thermoleophilaceae bacterium]
MKPAPFDYVRAGSAGQAVAVLSEHGDDAKVLAGGQSLVAMMSMRLVRPTVLVDIAHIADLNYVRADADGLRIGAGATQSAVLRSPDVNRVAPLVPAALRWASHPAIRNRGTVVGSLVHADPAAELPAVALALDAELVVQGPAGSRTIPASELFVTYLTTSVEPDELAVELRIPQPPPGLRSGHAFLEVSRRHGDFALVAAGVNVATDASGRIESAAIVMAGIADTPVRAIQAEVMLAGGRLDDKTLLEDVGRAAAADLSPTDDVHASGRYRQRVAAVLVKRALVQATAGGRDEH